MDAYDLMAGAAGSRILLHLGGSNGGTAQSVVLFKRSTALISAYLLAAAGASQSDAAATPAYRDRAELRPFLTVTGGNVTTTLGQSINGAAEVVAAAGTSRALDASYSAPTRMYIGNFGDGTAPANLAIRSILYVPQANYPQAPFRALAGV